MLDDGEQQANIRQTRRALMKAFSAGVGAMALAGCGGSQGSDGGDGSGSGGDGSGSGSGSSGDSSNLQRVDTLVFAHWTGSQRPQYAEEVQQAQQEWEQLGLEFERRPLSFPNPLLDVMANERDFDIGHLAFGATAPRLDPEFYMNQMLHSNAIGDGGFNFGGWNNDEFDSLAEEQARTLDPEERQGPVYEAQAHEAEEHALITHLFPELVVGINTDRADPPSSDQTIPGEGFQSKWTLTHTLEPKQDDGAHAVALVEGEFSTINPMNMEQTQGIVYTRNIHDTLVITGPDSQPRNWLADEINVIDETTVEATIMDGQTFHDGEPVTPEDVAFSYEYFKEHNVPAVATFLETLDSASTDGEVITFNLSEPYAPFIPLTMQLIYVLPRHIWEGEDDPQTFFNNNREQAVIGNGPFIFSRLEEGTLLEYTVNPDHFTTPQMDILRYKLYGQQSAAVQAIIRGEATTMKLIQPSLVPRVEDNDGSEIHYQSQHKNHQFFPNFDSGMPFSDRVFRRALSMTVPREQMAQQIYNGRAEPGGSFIAPANEFWHNPDIEPVSTTPQIDEARTMLEEAGYDWDDDGRLMYPTS